MRYDAWDITAAVGLGLIAWGAYCIYPPAALVVVGIANIVLGILGSRARARNARVGPGKEAGGGS